jgi:hypothetical protein
MGKLYRQARSDRIEPAKASKALMSTEPDAE